MRQPTEYDLFRAAVDCLGAIIARLYRSALNSSVSRLILEAAPPMIHRS